MSRCRASPESISKVLNLSLRLLAGADAHTMILKPIAISLRITYINREWQHWRARAKIAPCVASKEIRKVQ